MQQLAKYAFANAKIRAMLSYLIEQPVLESLLESKDVYDLLDLLKKTPYKDVVSLSEDNQVSLPLLEKKLTEYDINIFAKVKDSLSTKPEKDFVSILTQRYEIEQLKTILRIWHKKLPVIWEDYVLDRNICFAIDYKSIIVAANIEEIILLLDHTPYKAPLLRSRDRYKTHNSSFYLEAALDIDYYNRLQACIAEFTSIDKKIANKILGIEIDIENINWIIRLRKYYDLGIGEMLEWVIPGGARINKDNLRNFYTSDGFTQVIDGLALGPYAKIKDLAQENIVLLENFLYEFLLREVRRALSGFPFTIGTVMGYLILKHKETRNLTSLINAKYLGWNKAQIVSMTNL